jgi:hypothetical protein
LCDFAASHDLAQIRGAGSINLKAATGFVLPKTEPVHEIVLLWAWKLRNDPEDRIAAQLVNVLTVYFSISLLCYCPSRCRSGG